MTSVKVFQDLMGTARAVLTPMVGMDHWSGDQRDDNVPIERGEMAGMALEAIGKTLPISTVLMRIRSAGAT